MSRGDEQRERFLATYAGCPACGTIVERTFAPSDEDKRLHALCPNEDCDLRFLVRDHEREPWRPLELDPEAES
jgi:hypothetical protein